MQVEIPKKDNRSLTAMELSPEQAQPTLLQNKGTEVIL